jgi:hypothetical protein
VDTVYDVRNPVANRYNITDLYDIDTDACAVCGGVVNEVTLIWQCLISGK